MTWFHRLLRRRSYEDDLDSELRFHLDLHESELIARGHSPEEARRQARLALGGPEQVKESCRDGRATRWLKDLLQDLRYGVRVLAKHRGFTAVATLALALGIGVNTAILSAVNGFVLRPLPVVDNASELMSPYWGKKSDADVWGEFSYPNFVDLREQNRSFSDLCAWSTISAGISSAESRNTGDDVRADVIWGEVVSANYFDVMGVHPTLGRAFSAEEDREPNADPVVVLSHSLWQRRFASDPAILDKTIYLDGHSFTVIGVMPEGFLGSAFFLRDAFWAPLAMAQQFGRHADWNTDRSYAVLNLYGRLKPGLTPTQAETDLNLVASHLGELYPTVDGDTKIQLTTEVTGRYQAATAVLRYGGLLAVLVSGLVLLLACANVANLMLARAASRGHEIGTRLAIGAGRGRIVRQLLTESLLLSLLGGGLGWAFATWGARLIRASQPPVPYPISFDFTPDAYVLRWMLLTSLVTTLLFGLAPALMASRTDLVAVIRGAVSREKHGRRRLNLRGALVVAQVTISIVVLICAGLFIRSLGHARETDPGFRTDNLVTMMIDPGLLAYDAPAVRRFYAELQRRIETQPGVRRAALVNEVPLMVERIPFGPIVKDGDADPPPNQGVSVEGRFVSPKYFDTMQTPLVMGRDFTEHDDADAPAVVIVNQEFARQLYGGAENAVGHRFRFGKGTPLMEIVGIAKDGRYGTLYEDPQTQLFLPVYQHPRFAMTLLVSAQSPDAVRPVTDMVRREIARLEPRLPVIGVMTADENLSLAYWGPRVAAGMASTFGLLALVLATMGLYSLMTYAVSQRTREIGIRMALGADLGDVLRMVVSQGMRMASVGVVLGLVGAFALTRVLAALLLGVGTTDVVTFVGVSLLLMTVAFAACYFPARRATRVDPLVALRHD